MTIPLGLAGYCQERTGRAMFMERVVIGGLLSAVLPTVILGVLRLAGVVEVSWWLVTAPLWGLWALAGLIGVAVGLWEFVQGAVSPVASGIVVWLAVSLGMVIRRALGLDDMSWWHVGLFLAAPVALGTLGWLVTLAWWKVAWWRRGRRRFDGAALASTAMVDSRDTAG